MQVTRKQAKDIDKASETLITCRSGSDSSIVGDSKRRGVAAMNRGEERVVKRRGTVVLSDGRRGQPS
jgi:hypothetical protein